MVSMIIRLMVCCFALCVSTMAQAEFVQLSIRLGEGDQALYGSLLLPVHKQKPPVVLIIAGSGATDRNGNSLGLPGKNNSLKMLAEELAIAGIASLRFDKRGVGESRMAGLSEADLRFQTYVADIEAWLKLLAADERFNGLALIGHSEGSTLGMLAAQNVPVKAYVSLAGPGQSAAKILRAQLASKLPPQLMQANEEILNQLEKNIAVTEVPAPLLALYRPSVQPYLMSWFPIVPSEEIRRLTMPVAIFQGDTDIQVGLSEAQLLAKAQPKAELHIVRGMNHILKQVPADMQEQVASYSNPDLALDPVLVTPLVQFLKKSFSAK